MCLMTAPRRFPAARAPECPMVPPVRVLVVHGLLALLVLLVARPLHAATTAGSFRREPVPAWVTRAELEPAPAPYDDGVRGGMVNALVDDQVRVGATVAHYVHRIRRVLSISGLETAGEVEISVDPSYETLVLHKMQIVRGRDRIDVIPTTTVRTLQNDSGEERTYDDGVTEVFLLPDVRVGDILDYEYSIRGQNSVFGGRFVRSIPLVESLRTERLRVRLLAPTSRPIRTAVVGLELAPKERLLGADRELLWEWRNVAALKTDAGPSDDLDSFAWIRMSEFPQWSDVAAWGLSLFDRQTGTSPLLDARVQQIQVAHADAAERATAALDFVQKEIRYLGVEAGEHSHLPHTPPEVLAQRFGDCKDKSLLLVTILRALGVEAAVALVNPALGAEVKTVIPGPLAFHHAIVRVRIGGRTYFVDPTLSHQGGSLEARSAVEYGAALVLAPGTTDLEDIKVTAPREPTTEAISVYTAGPGPEGASLEVVTTYRGADADRRREELEEAPRAELQKRYLEFYEATEPSARAVGELGVTDDVAVNVIVIRERYAISAFWSGDSAGIRAATLEHRLRSPGSYDRKSPVHVGPVFVRERIDLQFRNGVLPEFPALKLGDPSVTYSRSVEERGSTLRVTFELRTEDHSIAPDAVPAYASLVESIEHDLHWTLPERAKPKEKKPWTRGELYALGGALGVVALAGLAVAVRRLRFVVRRRRYRRDARIQAGESATTAIDVADRAGAETEMARARCAGGGALGDSTTPCAWSEIRIGDRAVEVARASCVACGRAAARYFHFKR